MEDTSVDNARKLTISIINHVIVGILSISESIILADCAFATIHLTCPKREQDQKVIENQKKENLKRMNESC